MNTFATFRKPVRKNGTSSKLSRLPGISGALVVEDGETVIVQAVHKTSIAQIAVHKARSS